MQYNYDYFPIYILQFYVRNSVFPFELSKWVILSDFVSFMLPKSWITKNNEKKGHFLWSYKISLCTYGISLNLSINPPTKYIKGKICLQVFTICFTTWHQFLWDFCGLAGHSAGTWMTCNQWCYIHSLYAPIRCR